MHHRQPGAITHSRGFVENGWEKKSRSIEREKLDTSCSRDRFDLFANYCFIHQSMAHVYLAFVQCHALPRIAAASTARAPKLRRARVATCLLRKANSEGSKRITFQSIVARCSRRKRVRFENTEPMKRYSITIVVRAHPRIFSFFSR